jgi:hypothetical protein
MAKPTNSMATGPRPVRGRKPKNGEPDSAADSTTGRPAPSEDEIRARAYHLYLERGGRDGADFDDWLIAEAELRKHQ